MDDWIYSKEALEAKSDILEASFSVYVEGQDDYLFWESLLNKIGLTNFHIEEVGGYEFLIPYMEKIFNEDAKIIVACDSHLSDISGLDYSHDRIVRTYGYSIENTMYNKVRLNLIVKKYCLKNINLEEDIEKWISDFSFKIKDLLVHHIANTELNKTDPIIKDKCIEYLSSDRSFELCENKIGKKLTELKSIFKKEEIDEYSEKVKATQKEIWYLIKGHFLTNAVINLIKKKVKSIRDKNITMSLDTLYAHCVNMNEFDTSTLNDVNYCLQKLEVATNTI